MVVDRYWGKPDIVGIQIAGIKRGCTVF